MPSAEAFDPHAGVRYLSFGSRGGLFTLLFFVSRGRSWRGAGGGADIVQVRHRTGAVGAA